MGEYILWISVKVLPSLLYFTFLPDINECQETPHVCTDKQRCHNFRGGYRCESKYAIVVLN